MGRRLFGIVFVCSWLTTAVAGQCAQDHRTDKKAGILVNDLSIEGPTTLSSDEIAEITGAFTGSCFDEDSEEMGERLRALFQNRGYFAAEVKGVHMKANDPLGVPKPVVVEAEVNEGTRYKFGEIAFVNTHAFTTERLRQEFPIKTGDWFSRDKVASGLQGLRKLYGSEGFLDYVGIPETHPASNGTIGLTTSIDEGPEYRLDKVEFLAKRESELKLRMQWKLEEGSVYNASYLQEYIESNRDLLPQGFDRSQVQLVRDCPGALVQVRFEIDSVEARAKPAAKEVACEKKPDKPKDSQ
jgi:outer membrane protein assembly factor BamA